MELNLASAAEAVVGRGRWRAGAGYGCRGVSTDSRAIGPGELFVALSGPRFDGHDFVSAALERGAAAAMVAETYAGEAEGAGDPRQGLRCGLWEILAAFIRRSHPEPAAPPPSPAATERPRSRRCWPGSWPGNGTRSAARATSTTWSGLPMTLLSLSGEHEAAVLEMGMSHPGEIARLTEIADRGRGHHYQRLPRAPGGAWEAWEGVAAAQG